MKRARLFNDTPRYLRTAQIASSIRTAFVAVSAVILCTSAAQTVSQIDSALQFEAASVKENRGASRARIFSFQPGGRFSAMNISVRTLIGLAYAPIGGGATWLPSFRIVGGPNWLDDKGFDVQAKASTAAAPEAVRQMLAALLKERFSLAWHNEQRLMPIYSLTLDRKDGRLGDRLTASRGPCAKGFADPVSTDAALPRCADRFTRGTTSGLQIQLADVDLDMLANRLSLEVGRDVTNESGLVGRFDVDLEYTPGLNVAPLADRAGSSDGLSIFSAVEEQLGLKLKSADGSVDVMVIDAVSALEPD